MKLHFTKITILMLISFLSFGQTQEISSNLQDYYPGDTVILTGAGWLPGENVQITLVHSIPYHPDDVLYSTADAAGNFVNTDYIVLPQELGEYYICTAVGLTSNLSATIYFTDAPRVSTVTFNPLSQTACVPLSGTTTVSFTIQSARGNNGTVNGVFTIYGVPSGVTASPLAGFTSNGGNAFPNRTLTLTISPSALGGSYPI